MKLFWEKAKKSVKTHRFTAAAVLALGLVLGSQVQGAMAYFTTYASAKGGMKISLGDSTTITEEFKDWKKIIRIENTGHVDCYVRAKVLAGEQYTIKASGSAWSQGKDGYWYYANPLAPGAKTEPLTASIQVPKNLNISFDVAVVQECTPVIYDSDGNPAGAEAADWSRAAQYVEEEDKD